ncbi:hypothetical protein DPMN_063788 [Dreissena polymorpha]|uniref:Uncharacterized protein n=1 Tax=Dreissena polymorpha TaxID=45954 RepID=A0A9D4CB66_DREPO|nr:hypothetical protein DPMN_063788 [Dreissena polymorpha]
MYAVNNDHDYFENTHEENFLKRTKITEITTEECSELEVLTRGQNTNDRWFEERGKRIQSSNYHIICSATEKSQFTRTDINNDLGTS